MSTYAPCDFCPGEVIVGKYEPILAPAVDDDGFPILDPATGRVQMIRLRLPQHRVRFVGQGVDHVAVSRGLEPRWTPMPDGPRSVFDPTGLVPVMCEHGLPEHPLGFPLQHGGQSFVRAKYGTFDFRCVVCNGAEPPADLTTPRDG